MAVIRVDEAARSGHMVVDEEGLRTFNRVFLVWTDTLMGPLDMLAQATDAEHEHLGVKLPARFDSYSFTPDNGDEETDANAVVQNHSPVRHPKDRRLWTVGVEYLTLPGWSAGEGEVSIERMFPEIRFGHQIREEQLDVDAAGNAIVNSAGTPYAADSPVRRGERPILTVDIQLNRLSYDPGVALGMLRKLNNAVLWGGVQIHHAKLMGWDAHRAVHTTETESTLYWAHNIIVHMDPRSFVVKAIDEGWKKKKVPFNRDTDPPEDATLAIYEGSGGHERTMPLLDGNGQPLAPGQDPVFNDFRREKEANFQSGLPGGLNLPELVVNLNPDPV